MSGNMDGRMSGKKVTTTALSKVVVEFVSEIDSMYNERCSGLARDKVETF